MLKIGGSAYIVVYAINFQSCMSASSRFTGGTFDGSGSKAVCRVGNWSPGLLPWRRQGGTDWLDLNPSSGMALIQAIPTCVVLLPAEQLRVFSVGVGEKAVAWYAAVTSQVAYEYPLQGQYACLLPISPSKSGKSITLSYEKILLGALFKVVDPAERGALKRHGGIPDAFPVPLSSSTRIKVRL